MKKRWLKSVCIGLVLITASINLAACDLFGGSNDNGGNTETPVVSTEVPVVDMVRVALNNLDLPGIVEVVLATPGEGALLVNENLRLWVPPDAVAQDTPVTVEKFLEPPEALTSTEDNAIEVAIISEFYDLGPDNTRFDNPVKVTLAYTEDILPAGADENEIAPIYFNGQNWVVLECQLDTVNNTVSFETEAFPGVIVAVAFGIPLGKVAVAGITTVTVGVLGYLGYLGYGHYVKDPVHWGKAGEYVTPNDPTVQSWADRAQISLTGENKVVSIKEFLKDPNAVKEFVSAGEGFIQFENNANPNAPAIKPVYQRDWNPNDWQKPTDYFKNGMVGDCKNVANAMASIFRHYGYQAKCADGYMVNDEGKTRRHGWLEVIIDGKPYYVGSRGEIMPLEQAVKEYTLTRPKGQDGEGFYWDETGQKPYLENWWDYFLEVEINSDLAIPGGEVVVNVFGPAGVALDIALTLENPSKVKTEHTGVTDTTNGEVRFTLQLDLNAQLGVYTVTAYNAENKMSEVGVFCVTALELSALLVSSKVEPGEMLEMKVRLNKPIVSDIWVNSDAVWTTDTEGYVTIYRAIPQDTQLGPYTLTLSAPEYNISKKVNYVVWIPATLKVNITPETVAPGGTFSVNVLIDPAQVVRITIRGLSKQWMTDGNGGVNIKMTVPQNTTPGVYEIMVQAPDLGLTASDTYTVTETLKLGLSDITLVGALLTINAEGEDEESYFEMQLVLGGSYIRVSGLNNNEIIASGTIPTGWGDGEMYYSFTFNKDLTAVTSGIISMVADTGEFYEVRFNNIPMNADYEDAFWQNEGLDTLVFAVKGTAVSSHLGSVNVNEPSLGTFSRYFAVADSEIIVILIAATESQIAGLIDE